MYPWICNWKSPGCIRTLAPAPTALVLLLNFIEHLDPRVLVVQFLWGLTGGRVTLQAVKDKLLAFFRYVSPGTRAKSNLLIERILVYLRYLPTLKRGLPTQKQICDASQGPDINFVVVSFPLNQFGSHIQWRSQDQCHALLPIELLGEPEINEFQLKVFLVGWHKH